MIKYDCRFYLGDRPCVHHKRTGVKCSDCDCYRPVGERIVVIKLAARGDVLRTTSILPGLRARYPQARLTWITSRSSLELFDHNPFVDRVLALEPDGLACLLAEDFDLALNLDTSPLASSLLSLAAAPVKRGFLLDRKGRVTPLGPPAEAWLRMSVFDDEKRANTRTYQEIAGRIAGLPSPPGPIVLRLSEEERGRARDFARRAGIRRSDLVIGFNTGAGGRWERKKWPEASTLELARRCRDELRSRNLLFGGPEEEERNRRLAAAAAGSLIDTGCRNSLRDFFARLDLVDILITSDTLALHAAVALNKRVIALFGPTSAAEIELYGRGEKVVSPIECVCCYLTGCSRRPGCMEMIEPEAVIAAARRQAGFLPSGGK